MRILGSRTLLVGSFAIAKRGRIKDASRTKENNFAFIQIWLTTRPFGGGGGKVYFLGSHFSQFLAKASTFALLTGMSAELSSAAGGFFLKWILSMRRSMPW